MPKPKSNNNNKSKGPATQTTSATPPSAPPSWPPFKPPLPVTHLTLELHPSTPRVALLPHFFPRSLCREYVAFLRTLSMQTTPSRPKRGEAVRVNDRFQVEDALFARRLWEQTGLKEALLEDNEHLRDLW